MDDQAASQSKRSVPLSEDAALRNATYRPRLQAHALCTSRKGLHLSKMKLASVPGGCRCMKMALSCKLALDQATRMSSTWLLIDYLRAKHRVHR